MVCCYNKYSSDQNSKNAVSCIDSKLSKYIGSVCCTTGGIFSLVGINKNQSSLKERNLKTPHWAYDVW